MNTKDIISVTNPSIDLSEKIVDVQPGEVDDLPPEIIIPGSKKRFGSIDMWYVRNQKKDFITYRRTL